MAQVVVFNLAWKVLELLRPLVRDEIKLAWGVKADLANLNSTVSIIKEVLLDAEKQAHHKPTVKVWLEKLKDVLHEAVDVLDDVATEALQRNEMAGNKMTKEVRIFFSSSNQLAFSLKMGHKIKAIRGRLDVIKKEKYDFHFNVGSNEPQGINRDGESRDTMSLEREDEVIGREDDKKEIIELLFDNNVVDDISIIAIVGIGGLGKTTLAQLVYKDENVENKFDLKLWICISDNLDIKRIIKEVLEQMKEWKQEESPEVMQNKLRKKLNENKCLIVLDDLWNEDREKWFPLKNLLMGDLGAKTGSRIIVTTRSEKVARIIEATSYPLRGLPKEKAWSLFVKMAFERGQESKYKALVAIGQKIVEYCDGLPLAIRTIGSILYANTSEIRWKSFLDNELPKIGHQENDKILKTLKLSYDHLPSPLKQCFAYCRLFPKDHRINVHTLINLWAAQGFIVLVNPKQRFEDVGREYFMALLWKSFFQDVENDELGNIESCKMHDLMHDLAGLVSGSESAILNSSGENDIEKVRHVSFNLVDSSMQFSIPILNRRKIHTVLLSSVRGNLGNLTCDALISNFKYLRTLDLSDLKLLVVPHSIGKLKHLRYLDLSRNYEIKILPNSITKMLNLQTLILRDCHWLRELPKGIKKLVNLRFLDIFGCYILTKMTLEIEHHAYLETILPMVVVRKEGCGASCSGSYKKKKAKSNGGPSQLKELHNLGGILIIENLGYGKDDVCECQDTNLNDRQHLQQLELKWGSWDGESECYYEMLEGLQPHPNLKALKLDCYLGVRIPSWFSSLTNLVAFELSSNHRLQHLPPLNQLPFLKYVTLARMNALEYIPSWVSSLTNLVEFKLISIDRVQHLPPLNQLPFLKDLSLDGMGALEYIWIDEDSVNNVLGASSSSSSSSKTPFFPSLSSLHFEDCPKLKGWWRNSDDDNEPHHLLLPSFPPSLSELLIQGCPNLTSVPPFPYLKERLELSRCSWKVLEQTMKMKMKMGAATTSTYFPLSQLQRLELLEMNDFESLPEEWLRNLVSLQELSVNRCDELVSLPWIGILSSLQTLGIMECHNLTSLPQEIRNLTSLKELTIEDCSNLTSLPQEIRNLTSLKELYIWDCPLLEQRCKRQIGEDWPLIAHVPRVICG